MRLRQRGGEPVDGGVETEESLDFEWPQLGDAPPPVDPQPQRGPRRRWRPLRRLTACRPWSRLRALRLPAGPTHRRRLVAAFVLALLVAAGGAAVALLVGGSSAPDRAHAPAAGRAAAKRGATPRQTALAMPLSRQVAQLFVVGTSAQGPRDPFVDQLRWRGWGGVVISSLRPGQATRLSDGLAAAARAGGGPAPLVVAYQPGGAGSTFPRLPPTAAPAVGQGGQPAIAAREATAAAAALKRLHVSMTLAPMADVATITGPNQDVLFGDDPRLVARMAAAAVDGYRRGGVIPAVGHFPGQGAASTDPDGGTASVGLSLEDLRRGDLRPFRAIARTAPVVVISNAVYAAYDGVTPAALLPDVVTGLLRAELGFKGVAMTDDLVSTAPVLGQTVARSAVEALAAGADLLYVSDGPAEQEGAYRAVLVAVRQGKISRERLRTSVERVLALKRRFGLLAPAPARGR